MLKAIIKELHNGLGKATTTTSNLEAEQGSGNISKTQTNATPYGPSSLRTSLEGGPECHVTMGIVMFRLGLKGYLTCPMNHHSEKVATLENDLKSTKAVYNKALITLTKRVKKLEKKLKHKIRKAVVDSSKDEEASLNQKDSPKQGRMIEEIDEDENTNLVKSKIKKKETIQISLDEEIDQRFYEEEQAQLLMDEEYAQQVQAQWIQANEDMAQRMLEEERESLSIEERSRLLTEFIDKIKKMLAVRRAKEKRNKPRIQAQQRTYMGNYDKNIGGYTLKELKQYSFDEIKIFFKQTIESIRNFVPMESEDQIADSKEGDRSLKECKSLKRLVEEDLGQEQQKKHQVKEENVQQDNVIAKQEAVMQDSEPSKKIKKKEMIQIILDEEIAQRFDEEEQAQLLIDEEYAQ
nr:hypothetical protein [Tanacetum cinerariifolium]